MFLATCEFFDGPLSLIIKHLVLCMLALCSLGYLKCAGSGIPRQVELCHNLGRYFILGLSRLYFEGELEFVLRQFIDEWVNPVGCLIISVDSVIHNQELTIGRSDCQGLESIEVPGVDALVECAIIKNHLANWSHHSLSNYKIVVENKSQTWVSLEVRLHLDDTVYGAIDHRTIGAEKD